ncbi:MFS transporter [Nocardia sp. NEAU-G5]|uniref:MFS transporter n=1 Tax=Nocardia albiluteola TaxID=2842303 RepID=A0ABS6B6I5_9NOCA|nr:MFS transporter [Nocardia albiluteola]MBU3065928.1 MFS transporter [Nocardia albiluteola]
MSSVTQPMPPTAIGVERARPRQIGRKVLRAMGFLSFYDRFATAPMILLIALHERVGFTAAAALVTVYAFSYAIGQPLWGVLSDRVGRGRVIRVALLGMLVSSLATVVCPGFPLLLVSRAVCGLFVGALFPTVLTLIGDRYDGIERLREVSALQTFTALGTTLATLAAGAVGSWTDWRVPFGSTAVGAVVMLLLTWRTTESVTSVDVGSRSIRSAFGRWPVLLYFLGIVEGGLLLGIFTFVAPALQHAGASTATAGALAATYGLGIVTGSWLMRRVSSRMDVSRLIAIGGGLLTIAFVIAGAGAKSVIALTAAAVVIGLSNSFLHGSLQTWAISAAPAARATAVSFFVGAVFLGSSIATAIASPFVSRGVIGTIFLTSAVLTVALALGAALLHARWAAHSTHA